jgi:hypothetical protein
MPGMRMAQRRWALGEGWFDRAGREMGEQDAEQHAPLAGPWDMPSPRSTGSLPIAQDSSAHVSGCLLDARLHGDRLSHLHFLPIALAPLREGEGTTSRRASREKQQLALPGSSSCLPNLLGPWPFPLVLVGPGPMPGHPSSFLPATGQ